MHLKVILILLLVCSIVQGGLMAQEWSSDPLQLKQSVQEARDLGDLNTADLLASKLLTLAKTHT